MERDLPALAEMRWNFRTEDSPDTPRTSKDAFIAACTGFLRRGLEMGNWVYWIAERDGTMVSHIFVQRIAKVPKPNRLHEEYGYVTNVYTRPAYRRQGIGSELLRRVQAWAKEQDLEMLIVWPGGNAVPFYEREGFHADLEALVYEVRSSVE